ncbi:MAG TPA: diguanylate cyclase [Thermoleophilaceae bacterium]|nr:diguanylate cyclase [Thermoleophilaceae bacterium]
MIAAACVLFAVILAWRFADADPASAIGAVYVVPIALLAVHLGVRGGLVGAGVAIILSALWAHLEGIVLDVDGYLARGMTFAAVALVVGHQVKSRRRSQAEADRWFAISDDMCAVSDFNGYFTRVNSAWTDYLGYSAEEMMSKPYFEFVHPDDLERTEAEAAGLMDPDHSTVQFENRYRAKDGSWHWLLWSSRSDGKAIYGSARDITERKHLELSLQEMATHDKLTGIPNRRGWEERLLVETRRAARTGEPLTVAMMDIDNLKALNDAQGHAAGDRLLRAGAAGWSNAIRETDFIARVGGDEFAVLLPNCTEADAELVLQRMHQATPSGHRFSVGTALWDGGESLLTLLERADQALYDDKTQARKGVRSSR